MSSIGCHDVWDSCHRAHGPRAKHRWTDCAATISACMRKSLNAHAYMGMSRVSKTALVSQSAKADLDWATSHACFAVLDRTRGNTNVWSRCGRFGMPVAHRSCPAQLRVSRDDPLESHWNALLLHSTSNTQHCTLSYRTRIPILAHCRWRQLCALGWHRPVPHSAAERFGSKGFAGVWKDKGGWSLWTLCPPWRLYLLLQLDPLSQPMDRSFTWERRAEPRSTRWSAGRDHNAHTTLHLTAHGSSHASGCLPKRSLNGKHDQAYVNT